MAGYTPWMAGAAQAAKRANAAEAARVRAAKRTEYNAYRAESRACGYEVESFEKWMGETTARQLAEDRMGYSSHRSLSDLTYYSDSY
jgi:hypothetical protein